MRTDEIQTVTDLLLEEGANVEAVLHESWKGSGSVATKWLTGIAKENASRIITYSAGLLILGVLTKVFNWLQSPKARNKYHKIIEGPFPAIENELKTLLRRDMYDLVREGAMGEEPNVDGFMDRANDKIDRVIDRHLPAVFKAISTELRKDFKDRLQWSIYEDVKAAIKRVEQQAQDYYV